MARPFQVIGISTINAVNTRSFNLTNVDLVNQDLLNAFYTLPGENKMRPTWGCLLRKRIFEQYYAGLQDLINQDVMNVINADPRVSLISSTISEIPYGLVISLNLNYIQLNTISTLLVPFNTDTDSPYGYSGS